MGAFGGGGVGGGVHIPVLSQYGGTPHQGVERQSRDLHGMIESTALRCRLSYMLSGELQRM